MPTEIRVLTSQNKSLQTKIGVRKTKDTELLKPGLNVSSTTFFSVLVFLLIRVSGQVSIELIYRRDSVISFYWRKYLPPQINKDSLS